MSGADICDALEVVYTVNTVHDLLSGKAVIRALRSQQLHDLLINTILEDLLPELDVDSGVLENMITDAKNGRLGINNL